MYRLKEKQKDLSPHILSILSECQTALNEIETGAKLVLYGSYARGSAGPESDLDLLILLDQELTIQKKKQIRDLLYEISLKNDVVISAIIKSTSTWDMPITKATPLYNNIQRFGVAIG
ncbi:MAG: nucleotidyltransferase domain-containing protein [Sedimentisphaerales bacterium]